MMPGEAARALWLRTLAGDHGASAELLSLLAPVVHARVHRVLTRRGLTARSARQQQLDLVQEVFVVLLDRDARVLRAWQPERGLSLENFVGLVTEREIVSLLRSGRRSGWAECPTDDVWFGVRSCAEPDPARVCASRELADQLLSRLRCSLSPHGYALFEALFVEEAPVEGICERFGLSSNALYSFRSRARKLALSIAAELSQEEPALLARLEVS